MTPKKRIENLEAAAARRVDIEPREPDDVDRMLESPDALAAELARGRCGRLLLLSPDEPRPVLSELPPDDSPLTEAEAEMVAPRAKELAESIFAKLAAAETPQEYVAAVHSNWVVTEATLRAAEEWFAKRDQSKTRAARLNASHSFRA